jgi:hypothetical protein
MRIGASSLGLMLALRIAASDAANPGVDTTELARCAAISVSMDRLGCYDALARAVQGKTTLAALDTPVATPPPFAPAAVAVTPPPAPASTFGITQPSEPNTQPESFGITKPQPSPEKPQELREIKSTVDKVIEDRSGGLTLVFDNNQSWMFLEGGATIRPGDQVVVRRASLGSFLLITPSKRSYRVRRVQ